jgi:hypothetical protein
MVTPLTPTFRVALAALLASAPLLPATGMAAPLCAQETPAKESPEPAAPAAGPGLAQASPEARALWGKVCAASGSAKRAPLNAFQLEAEVLTRGGVQSNEMRIDYRYLAPDCIRFMLPSKDETGRFGPAPEQYWVLSGKNVVTLAGREYKEDRQRVDDMLSLARNYVALSNPARLDLRALELGAAPTDLGPALLKKTKKLRWLVLESPDFALVKSDAPRSGETIYRVELGLREDNLPGVAIVREKGRPDADPLLVEFGRYETRDDFTLPFQLLVYVLDRSHKPAVFADEPSQEVYVTAAALRPPLTVADFDPRAKDAKK